MAVVIIAFALVAALAVGMKLAERAEYKDFRERAARVKATGGVYDAAPVTEEDLRDVPEPLARYMQSSGAVGQKPISAVHVLHSGRFKPGADKPWMPIRGEYFITTKTPSFTWYGKIGIAGVHVVAVDSYADGRGRMLVKALSVFPIVDDHDGIIERDVQVAGATVEIAGEIRKPLHVVAEKLDIPASARILGPLTYKGSIDARIAEGAIVNGPITYDRIPQREARDARAFPGVSSLLFSIHLFLAGVLVVIFVPRVETSVVATLQRSTGQKPARWICAAGHDTSRGAAARHQHSGSADRARYGCLLRGRTLRQRARDGILPS